MSLLDEFTIPNINIQTPCGAEGAERLLEASEALRHLSGYCEARAREILHRADGEHGTPMGTKSRRNGATPPSPTPGSGKP
jgi:hypothetical protein